jgi:hypothetical protein
MRKAGAVLREATLGRRPKDNNTSPSNNKQNNNKDNTAISKDRRQASPEELALTAKNYRLAKELSELRVRHREECRTVTRLSMDNVSIVDVCNTHDGCRKCAITDQTIDVFIFCASDIIDCVFITFSHQIFSILFL